MSENQPQIGQHWEYHLLGLTIDVIIMNIMTYHDCLLVLVTPLSGSGMKWLRADSLKPKERNI